ncbi:MAG: FAD-dependent oxidoreductase [Proteobacteria bacterium]|nr:FAD-dependent oxidoreductase [Pseudomonadota bacterium]MBI3496129.1 FAD-dependent oxidoreductase [Pseudomonadota bacterium]
MKFGIAGWSPVVGAPASATEFDVVVAGSGAAGLAAALTAARGGLSVLILEKSDKLGGTSAMSGAGTWIPANHLAKAAGLADSPEEALTYLRATAPKGWQTAEDALWRAFVDNAPRLLEFVERETPLRFELIAEPDPIAERPGGKLRGRMLSTLPLSRRIVGRYGALIRRSTLPHLLTYRETIELDPYHRPIAVVLRLLPKLARRWLSGSAAQGNSLVVGLLKGCLDLGCRIELGARVVELITETQGGRIVGVVVDQQEVRTRFTARRGVVLATGGFEWSHELFTRYFPGPIDRIGSPRSNTGDGQRLAQSVGARLDRMDQANIYPNIPARYEGRRHGMPATFQAEPHAILVDRNGRRFISEYDYNIGEAIDRRDPASGEPMHLPCWVIGDSRYLSRSPMLRWYARNEPSWIHRVSSLAELAKKIGVPADALAETVARFNAFCAAGRDADYQRGESTWQRYKSGWDNPNAPNPTLGPIEQRPFVALSFNRSTVGTKGGARTNERGQVLRPDGSVVAGLFAAGNVMANPIGTRAVGAGTTIGPCMTWGYICGQTLMMENPPAMGHH